MLVLLSLPKPDVEHDICWWKSWHSIYISDMSLALHRKYYIILQKNVYVCVWVRECACFSLSISFWSIWERERERESKWCQITYDTTVEVSFYARESQNQRNWRGRTLHNCNVTHSAPFPIIIAYINIFFSSRIQICQTLSDKFMCADP